MTALLEHEGFIRMASFIGVFTLMAILELQLPRKKKTVSKRKRWLTNIGLIITDSVMIRILLPTAAVGVASYAEHNNWGILSLSSAPAWFEIILAIILLDALIYAQHVASHKIPFLWRFHKVHHVDRDLDVTSGFRFHPVEILLSMLFKFICIITLGVPAIAVMLFEVLLNASAMFNHSNVRIPSPLDITLRKVVVTPDMHRVHHSVIQTETDSNYGFFLSIWDKLFKTYRAQPKLGHDNMLLGLTEHQTEQPSSLLWCLLLPFHKKNRKQ